ncbi:hypothetical protein [Pseudoalteromonas sp. RB2-MNA-CIBAN-0110]|uniref:hypothetical protein n=1 Tax=Pseudoalteromonas sp. RB2-MNA-CIBAN-0110 TaxID=3140439 RepID=UPI003320833D
MKDWIVTIQQKTLKEKKAKSKGRVGKNGKIKKNKTLESNINYLLDNSHKNHYYTEITDLGNARETYKNILMQVDKRASLRAENSIRGGGVSNVASSFVLGLPADLVHPTVEQWRDIHEKTLNNFVERFNESMENKQANHNDITPLEIEEMSKRQLKEYHLNTERFKERLDIDQVLKLSTAVVHDDRNKPFIAGATSGSHLNITMSNVMNGEVIKALTQKQALHDLKQAFKLGVKETLDLESYKYIPEIARQENDLAYSDDNEHLKTKKYGGETIPRSAALAKKREIEEQALAEKEKAAKQRLLDSKARIEKEQKEKSDKFTQQKKSTINKLKAHNKNNIAKEKTLNKKEKIIDKKSNELTNYFNNILESDLIKSFVDKIIARGKAKHIGPMELVDTETKLIKEFNEELVESYRELNPKELKKHVEREKVKADELAVKIQKRHDTNEFKTQQELDIEKSKLILNTPKKKTIKEKLVGIGTKLGMFN